MTDADAPESARIAMRRWRLGHHAFHLQLVVMNTLLTRADQACAEGRWADLTSDLVRLRTLYNGATATMALAAAFDSDMYNQVVRPSMEPPFLAPGFSAAFGREHTIMLRRIERLHHRIRAGSSTKEGRPDQVLRAHRELQRAQARNRREHVLICRRFVQDGKSLLRESEATH
ncbi:hypothetical protein SAMN05216266_110126 [Amycolatopsis marina]|uniref:Uncharacterized protein n=1 Tax=Amycolatopsis marina TaxID=490629 RepID=A0A1I1ASH9_9PSEU|nr:hypothetical protein [Amycolatopsis marina]SFB40991.1 hypothetical protein SAMN05216266_110126 [Amycolatopsis marina]